MPRRLRIRSVRELEPQDSHVPSLAALSASIEAWQAWTCMSLCECASIFSNAFFQLVKGFVSHVRTSSSLQWLSSFFALLTKHALAVFIIEQPQTFFFPLLIVLPHNWGLHWSLWCRGTVPFRRATFGTFIWFSFTTTTTTTTTTTINTSAATLLTTWSWLEVRMQIHDYVPV